MSDVALELASITKRFGRLTALDAASLRARRGTVHALLGENGAGKTTLMHVAFGMVRPDSGSISTDGVSRVFSSPSDAIDVGVGMVHQHFTLVSAMTVAENIALGGRGRYNPSHVRDVISALSERPGLAVDPNARIEDLSAGAQQRVEILKALSRDTRILILDEPTAVLTPKESRELLRKVRELVGGGGTAILITHRLRDALEFADDISVLRRGATVWSGAAKDATEESLVAAMLGGERIPASAAASKAPLERAAPVLSLQNVSVDQPGRPRRLGPVTLCVSQGEIVGIAAVEGNGQHELLRILSGRMRPTSGDVSIPAVVGFIPEDRQRDALIQDFSLRDNFALLGASKRNGIIDWSAMGERTRGLIRDYDVRAGDDLAPARSLSGGNQQKLVVGREIQGSRMALVAENPSRGLDVQATAAVHARLRAARDAGMAVVIYSSDLDEVLALAERIIVVHGGVVSEPPRDYESIGRAMLGLGQA